MVLNLIKIHKGLALSDRSSLTKYQVRNGKPDLSTISLKGRNFSFPDGIKKGITPALRLPGRQTRHQETTLRHSARQSWHEGTTLKLSGQQSRHKERGLRHSGRQSRHEESVLRLSGQQTGHEESVLRHSGRQSRYKETTLRLSGRQTRRDGHETRRSGPAVCFRFIGYFAQPPPDY